MWGGGGGWKPGRLLCRRKKTQGKGKGGRERVRRGRVWEEPQLSSPPCAGQLGGGSLSRGGCFGPEQPANGRRGPAPWAEAGPEQGECGST